MRISLRWLAVCSAQFAHAACAASMALRHSRILKSTTLAIVFPVAGLITGNCFRPASCSPLMKALPVISFLLIIMIKTSAVSYLFSTTLKIGIFSAYFNIGVGCWAMETHNPSNFTAFVIFLVFLSISVDRYGQCESKDDSVSQHFLS